MSQPPEVNPDTVAANSATLEWDPPMITNGKIISYNVNLVAILLATGFSSESRIMRRETSAPMAVDSACIVGGGGNVDRTFSVDPQNTSLIVNDLSESL